MKAIKQLRERSWKPARRYLEPDVVAPVSLLEKNLFASVVPDRPGERGHNAEAKADREAPWIVAQRVEQPVRRIACARDHKLGIPKISADASRVGSAHAGDACVDDATLAAAAEPVHHGEWLEVLREECGSIECILLDDIFVR